MKWQRALNKAVKTHGRQKGGNACGYFFLPTPKPSLTFLLKNQNDHLNLTFKISSNWPIPYLLLHSDRQEPKVLVTSARRESLELELKSVPFPNVRGVSSRTWILSSVPLRTLLRAFCEWTYFPGNIPQEKVSKKIFSFLRRVEAWTKGNSYGVHRNAQGFFIHLYFHKWTGSWEMFLLFPESTVRIIAKIINGI